MSRILELFPYIAQTKKGIEEQNKLLQKISLTGKINTVDKSVILFDSVDEAIEKFDVLKEKLVNALIEETIEKIKSEFGLNAKLCIDVLKRNLYERTADVGFLSQDDEVVAFLNRDLGSSYAGIKERLQEYVAKYSVYDDVIIFDVLGNVKVNINPQNRVKKSKDKILKKALKSDGYVEQFSHSDIFRIKKRSLLYAHKIVNAAGKALGVLVLSFRFDDEMEEIFSALEFEDQILTIEDNKEVIASSKPQKVPLHETLFLKDAGDFKLFEQKYITFCAKTSGYQGYFGLDWQASAIMHSHDISSGSATDEEVHQDTILPDDLQAVIDEVHEVIEDLSDVIINGEIIASRNKIYTLSPILDNLRDISGMLVENIDETATKLTDLTTVSGLINTVNISTKFAIDVMDRNLYERANDCRWWALNKTFINGLKADKVDGEKLSRVLNNINELYTVYTNLFIYDKDRKIVASSRDKSILGEYFDQNCATRTLNSTDTQNYFVSGFEKSQFYGGKPTYIYNATIFDEDGVLGGIGIVFDAEVEFKAILKDSFLENKEGFSCFCDRNATIISTTHPNLYPLDRLDIADKYFQSPRDEIVHDFITFEDKKYLICIAPSGGYREYKREDGYRNDLVAITFIKL